MLIRKNDAQRWIRGITHQSWQNNEQLVWNPDLDHIYIPVDGPEQ